MTNADLLYVIDGMAICGGHNAFYLYALDDNVEPAIARIIELNDDGTLPTGMQIGVLVPSEAHGARQTFQPRFPFDLADFEPPPIC